MKLVVIMSVEACADVLERLYAEHRIPVFSEMNIAGFRLAEDAATPPGWFGGVFSKLTFAFVPGGKATELMDVIETYNRAHPSASPIRAFQMPVERAV